MASIGVIRKIDVLGRVVIPKEFRDTFGLDQGTEVEMFADKNMIRGQKYRPGCIFCGDITNIVHFNGIRGCKLCITCMAVATVNKHE